MLDQERAANIASQWRIQHFVNGPKSTPPLSSLPSFPSPSSRSPFYPSVSLPSPPRGSEAEPPTDEGPGVLPPTIFQNLVIDLVHFGDESVAVLSFRFQS